MATAGTVAHRLATTRTMSRGTALAGTAVSMAVSDQENGDSDVERQMDETTVSFLGCLEGPEELRWVISDLR